MCHAFRLAFSLHSDRVASLKVNRRTHLSFLVIVAKTRMYLNWCNWKIAQFMSQSLRGNQNDTHSDPIMIYGHIQMSR